MFFQVFPLFFLGFATDFATFQEAEALVLIVNGVASVLKKVRVEKGVVEQQTVGRLRGGAIIGDLSLIGAQVPRAATVRAKTDVEAIVVPGRSVLQVLSAFPTLLNPATDRLVDTAECIKELEISISYSLCNM